MLKGGLFDKNNSLRMDYNMNTIKYQRGLFLFKKIPQASSSSLRTIKKVAKKMKQLKHL